MANATELIRALAHGDRLAFIAHINSKAWEVVGGGPLGLKAGAYAGLGLNPAVIAGLNPQPLPPVDGPRTSYTAVGYGQLVTMAVAAIGQGEGGQRTFLSDVDDWCGTGWPRRWPWPPPKGAGRDDIVSLQLGAGVAAAVVAAGYEDGQMREMFESASTMLLDAAIGG